MTLVESILENPELILRRQLDKIKGEAVAQMKADGLDYDQRMEKLEKLEYRKPQRDFIYGTFNAFADRHPWVGKEDIRPKSIAREMFEGFRPGRPQRLGDGAGRRHLRLPRCERAGAQAGAAGWLGVRPPD